MFVDICVTRKVSHRIKISDPALERNPFSLAPLQNQAKSEEEWIELNSPHDERKELKKGA